MIDYENDPNKFAAINLAETKKNRIIVAKPISASISTFSAVQGYNTTAEDESQEKTDARDSWVLKSNVEKVKGGSRNQ